MSWARLEFPPEFMLGLEGLARAALWRVRRSPDGPLVSTVESYEHRELSLVHLTRLATAANAADSEAYESLSRWQPQDSFGPHAMTETIRGLPEVREPASATDAFVGLRLQFMTVPDREVPGLVQAMFVPLATQMPNAAIWAMEFDAALRWRVAAVRMLFGAREHPEVLGEVQRLGGRLPTPTALLPSLGFGLDAFTEPALLPASPWILGMNAIRAGGQIVVLFGDAFPGFTGKQADDALGLLRGRSAVARSTPRPMVSPAIAEQWLRWWVKSLNRLLGRALDVGRYVDDVGRYDPGLHLGVLASLERLFSNVQGILATTRQPLGRVRRMFEVVDLLDGLSFGGWESMLRPDNVARQLERLRTELPAEVHDLALTRCLSAISALDEFGAGFQPRSSDGLVRVRSTAGAPQDVTVAAATHTYLRLIRNAGSHSFRKALQDPYQRSILAAHKGDLPDALADLAWFHLLRFLADPRLPVG